MQKNHNIPCNKTGKKNCHTIVPGILIAALAPECYAYIDPGTGSLILQSIIATVAVLLATGRMWWHKLLSFFNRNEPAQDAQPLDNDPGGDDS